ncbi:MAG: L,D-transpeptidase, partial [Pseudomonadota bacterium]
MITRRFAVFGTLAATAAAALTPLSGAAAAPRFRLARRLRPRTVRFSRAYRPGTIVVDPRRHYLYLVLSRGRARRYGVGVGKAGRAFRGRARIGRKAVWPRWTPT